MTRPMQRLAMMEQKKGTNLVKLILPKAQEIKVGAH